MISPERIKEILEKISRVTVAVYGDFALDAYWILSPEGGEISEETGLKAEAVSRHYYTLGGAANVVANLAALKPAEIRVIGAIGDDIFGRELRRQFTNLSVDTSGLVIQKEGFDTVTFAKRILKGRELPRIDFGFLNRRSRQTDQAILAGLRRALEDVDATVFNQQVPDSLNDGFIEDSNRLFQDFSHKIILLDSRHYGHRFRHIYRKTNAVEAARLNGVAARRDDTFSLEESKRHAKHLFEQSGKPVFVTRGAHGLLVYDEDGATVIPGIKLEGPLDPVGAGDTVVSALTLCLAAGLKPAEAAGFANLAAAVTVQKLYMTGTASGAEILELRRKIGAESGGGGARGGSR